LDFCKQDLQNDAHLKQYIPQHVVQTHIWEALILHKSNAPTAEVAEHASAASQVLISLLTPPEALVRSKSVGKRPAGTGRQGTVAKRGSEYFLSGLILASLSINAMIAKTAGTSSVAPPAKRTAIAFDDRMGLIQSMGECFKQQYATGNAT
jgi:hypothetical protein